MGWITLCLAVIGAAAPIAFLFLASRRYHDDIGWQEGGGVIVFGCCLILVIICQIIALVLARLYAWHTTPGKWACGIATAFLFLAVVFIGLIIYDHVRAS